ncbi:MAG: hypothetical protein KDA84_05675 [Planctomycetaceae bacterium]|nr:hypothetical protein [Planctomycetaceae bacterium]
MAAILKVGSPRHEEQLAQVFPGMVSRIHRASNGEPPMGWQCDRGRIVGLAAGGPAFRSGFSIGDTITDAASSVSIDRPVPARSFRGVRKNGVEFHRDVVEAEDWTKRQLWGESSVWVNNNSRLTQDFVRETQSRFGTAIFTADFTEPESRGFREMDEWLKRRHGIWQKTFAPGGVVGAYLIAVSHLNEQWKSPFDPQMTYRGVFGDQEAAAMFMKQHRSLCKFAKFSEFDAILLPLRYGHVVFVLPHEGHNSNKILTWFGINGFGATVDALLSSKPVLRELHIPRFSFSSTVAFGDIFSDANLIGTNSVLERMFENQTGFVNDIILSANVSCDEVGFASQGAAVSEILVLAEEPAFKLDRPFLFFSVNEEFGLVDVVGVVNTPTPPVRE